MRATVKQFYEGLNEMRRIYPFKDEETYMGTENPMSMSENRLTIRTEDKETGILIIMEKIVGGNVGYGQ